MKVVKIIKAIFALIVILGFYMIVKHSYFGVVDENGNKVTNMQEILQMEQENNAIQNNIIENSETQVEENSVSESKESIQEKSTGETQAKANTQTKKNESTSKTASQESKTTEVSNVKPNTTVTTEQKQEENKQESYTETEVKVAEKKECNGNNHAIGVGNTDKWFNTKAEAESYYDKEIAKWGALWESGEKTKEEYLKNCPSGYEVWTCPICQKWTLNYYYR